VKEVLFQSLSKILSDYLLPTSKNALEEDNSINTNIEKEFD